YKTRGTGRLDVPLPKVGLCLQSLCLCLCWGHAGGWMDGDVVEKAANRKLRSFPLLALSTPGTYTPTPPSPPLEGILESL
ncbi:hypothetical protein JB92DRAFT_2875520, partial [Gautieria morchelliformis]